VSKVVRKNVLLEIMTCLLGARPRLQHHIKVNILCGAERERERGGGVVVVVVIVMVPVTFEVFTAVLVKCKIFCDLQPC
jgi:hypothetical protein